MRVQSRILEDLFKAAFSKRIGLILVAMVTLASVFSIAGCDGPTDRDSSAIVDSSDARAADGSSEEPDLHGSGLSDQHHRMMDSHPGDPDHHETDSSDEQHRRGGMHGRDGQ